MEDKEKIIAEIERLITNLKEYLSSHKVSYYAKGCLDQATNILAFINSLSEEPVSEDLEEAVNVYIGHKPDVDEGSSVYGKRQAFKAGAQWKKERLIDRACEWLQEQEEFIGISFQEDFIERFKEAMED